MITYAAPVPSEDKLVQVLSKNAKKASDILNKLALLLKKLPDTGTVDESPPEEVEEKPK